MLATIRIYRLEEGEFAYCIPGDQPVRVCAASVSDDGCGLTLMLEIVEDKSRRSYREFETLVEGYRRAA